MLVATLHPRRPQIVALRHFQGQNAFQKQSLSVMADWGCVRLACMSSADPKIIVAFQARGMQEHACILVFISMK